jgi:hypothetical protein
MPDFIPGRQTMVQGVEPAAVFVGGQEVEFIFGQGTQLFPNLPVPIYGVCDARVVSDAGEKWFEFCYRMDAIMSGNAGAGWTDDGSYFRLEPQWSPDLVAWSMGKFIPAPVPVVDLGGGFYEYWARAINPQDSAVKSGAITVSNAGGDSRNNGITSLVIAGVSQALANFPYDMSVAGKSAQMQADIRALGWTGAIVTGSTATNWTISIPTVNYTSYSQSSYVGFPTYLVADMFGELNQPVSNLTLSGNLVDAAGTPIFQKAFARLKISAGTRYDPYL